MDFVERIGIAAGEVWKALKAWQSIEDGDSGMTIPKLKYRTNLPNDLLYEALGWLARENKVVFFGEGKKARVYLKE
ncbi:MAG: hypothetical protein GXP33_03960 [Spirochaetes bacterium]|nr:hypothetical protein [Spirochaetota bacterium]